MTWSDGDSSGKPGVQRGLVADSPTRPEYSGEGNAQRIEEMLRKLSMTKKIASFLAMTELMTNDCRLTTLHLIRPLKQRKAGSLRHSMSQSLTLFTKSPKEEMFYRMILLNTFDSL